jgi:hypothetical protein
MRQRVEDEAARMAELRVQVLAENQAPLERERQLKAECDALKAAKQTLHWQDDAARIADKVLSIQVQVPMLYRSFGLSRLTRHAGPATGTVYGGSPGPGTEPEPARMWRRVEREGRPIREPEPEAHHDGSRDSTGGTEGMARGH